MPWVAVRLRALFVDPGFATGLVAGVSLSLLGVLSPHLFLVAAVLGGVLLVTHAVAADNRLFYAKQLAPGVLTAAGATVLLSAYWIIPTLAGLGHEGTVISGTGPGELSAYAVVPDQHLGLLPNLLGLYGFWAENSGRFTSMKDFVPVWPVILALLLLIGGIGAASAFRRRSDRLAPWVAGLLIAAVIAVLLEMGVSHALTAGLVRWLDATVPVYRGMRDAGKWAALLALVYSQLSALGVVAILDSIRRWKLGATRTEWLGATATGLLLAMPLYYGNGLLFGMHGEIKPSQYPPGWYAADRVLVADSHPGRTLFLPWHEYLDLSFVRNENSVVASPAPTFFSTLVLVSSDPEVPGIEPPSDPEQTTISGLVAAGSQGRWAQVLAARNVKYVLLAREVDWSSYGYLDSQPGLVRVGDYGSIVLYRKSLVA